MSLNTLPDRAGTKNSQSRSGGSFADHPILFQQFFKSVGPRTYAAQIKQASNGNHYLLLTEGKREKDSDEVRKTRLSHIDLDRKMWNRPAQLMKGRKAKAHSVTLNDQAIAILKRAETLRGWGRGDDPLVFPGSKGTPLSDMTLSKILRDKGLPYVPHGFRSSFRDWAAEKMPSIPDAVAEAALAHVVPDKVIAAYKRTTFLDLRRQLLDAWGSFVENNSSKVRQDG